MGDLRITDIDGVRCFWVDTGRPTLRALLMFRYGIADEPLTESGWQHLLEHLALDGRGGGAVQVNGSVSMLETTLDVHGPAEAVAHELSAIGAWLREPRLDRVDHERKVLAAEAQYRGGNPLARALSWRYGAQGPGVAAYDELGLGRASEESLRARAHAVFTSENAALVLDGPPPLGLRFDLHEGRRLPPQPARPVETHRGCYTDPVVSMTGVVERSHAAVVALELLRLGAEDALRHDSGNAYTVFGHYERVDDEGALLGLSAEVVRPSEAESTRALLELLDRLANEGPTPELLAAQLELREQGLRDPYAVIGLAYNAATRHLQGRDQEHLDELIAAIRAVSVDDVRESLASMSTTLMVGTPSPEGTGLPVFVDAARALETARGRVHRGVNWPADRSRLVVLDDAVEIRGGDGSSVRAARADLVGHAMRTDGRRTMIRRDGYVLSVDPTAWRHGAAAVEAVDRLVPRDLHLPVMHEHPIEPFQRAGALTRWLGGVGLAPGSEAASVVSGALVFIGVALLLAALVNGT